VSQPQAALIQQGGGGGPPRKIFLWVYLHHLPKTTGSGCRTDTACNESHTIWGLERMGEWHVDRACSHNVMLVLL
jgi:hypothetical protein